MPSEDPLCYDGRVRQEVKGLLECPEALGIFQMDLINICKFWPLIKTHHLLVRNIINMMPFNGCSQMLHISLKTEKSFIAHPWRLLCVVALRSIQLITGDPRPPVQRAPVTWREWGLWSAQSPSWHTRKATHAGSLRYASATTLSGMILKGRGNSLNARMPTCPPSDQSGRIPGTWYCGVYLKFTALNIAPT